MEARGELIIWTDDDVSIDPRWAAAYWSAARRHPEASFFGGTIDPWFESDPPDWLRQAWTVVCDAYAVRDLGRSPLPLRPDRLPFGASYAIRAGVQRHYLYDPRLGRCRDEMIGGEETHVARRMLADGLQGVWVPDARLRHFIPSDRMTEDYLRRFYLGQGQQIAALRTGRAPRSRRRLWTRALRAEARYQLRRRVVPSTTWLRDMKTASNRWGQLRGPRPDV